MEEVVSRNTPRDASSIIVVRRSLSGLPEVFLVKRHKNSGFMGGQYVFPGGKCDVTDSSPEIIDRCLGRAPDEVAQILGIKPVRAMAHFVAAIRETFEEAGVLLVQNDAGELPTAAAVNEARMSLSSRGFLSILLEYGWYLDLSALQYYAHWVTPEVEPRRFSARFFLAHVPPEQAASHDQIETTDGRWRTPSDALGEYEQSEIGLPPPQLHSLTEFSRASSVDAVLSLAANAPVRPHVPHFIGGDPPTLVLPGDPLHPEIPGGRLRRFSLEKGQWRMYFEGP